ncbi:hypothetical protein Vadar_033760 [Vaccinium darrowii]|uniref:Uncharacterized protein n=1 Tax=Vaccinium darrowii TaxID=229202 RepID=A0ACB7Z1A3_9ERIC|nr:hypothetical protein Vadar_033760 [Vaccinium darrowii]
MEPELPHLPHEILFDILSRLPVKPLCRFKSVSKPWLALITNPCFIKSQLNHQYTRGNHTQKLIVAASKGYGASETSQSVYSVDFKVPDYPLTELEVPCKSGVRILGSFNGVILLRIRHELCLWNPSIRTYRKFSQPKCPNGARTYGLCYDYVSDDFKVVRAVMPSSNVPCDVHVFTCKLGSWKKIGDLGYEICGRGPGMVVNGMPHWILRRGGSTDGTKNLVIVCFDATKEEFKEVPLPANSKRESRLWNMKLGIFGGWLCVVSKYLDLRTNVWVMKEYGVNESWTKLSVMSLPKGSGVSDVALLIFVILMPLCYAKDGEVVAVLNSFELVIYNPKKQTKVPIQPCFYHHLDVALYVESLFSPHGLRHCC